MFKSICQRILCLAEDDRNAKLFLSVARAMRNLSPETEVVLVDISAYDPSRMECAPVFEDAGFRAISLPESTVPPSTSLTLEFLREFERTTARELPSVMVVPHELGAAKVAVRLAHHRRIPSYQIQHGDYLPESFDDNQPPSFKANPFEQPLEPVIRRSSLSPWETQTSILRDEYRLMARCLRGVVRRARGLLPNMPSAEAKSASDLRSESLFRELVPFPEDASRYSFTTTRFGVNGEYWRRRLRATGVADTRIDVTGNLRTDQLFERPPKPFSELCAQYQLDPGRPLALYFHSPLEEGYDLASGLVQAIEEAIAVVHAAAPGWSVLVLNHPRRPMSLLEPILQMGRANVQIGRAGDDLWGLIRSASLIIGVMSSALTEAAAFRKPIVTLDYVLKGPALKLLTEFGAAIPVFHRCNLETQIRRAIQDRRFVESVLTNQELAARELVGPIDGKCGERAAQSILALAGSNGAGIQC